MCGGALAVSSRPRRFAQPCNRRVALSRFGMGIGQAGLESRGRTARRAPTCRLSENTDGSPRLSASCTLLR